MEYFKLKLTFPAALKQGKNPCIISSEEKKNFLHGLSVRTKHTPLNKYMHHLATSKNILPVGQCEKILFPKDKSPSPLPSRANGSLLMR